ncbi:MAG: fumarate hydratase, partial [Clostridia bacterium]|nr:fumarate hydratase [Clostridia bacterium]
MIKKSDIIQKVKEAAYSISFQVDSKTCGLLLDAESIESNPLSRFALNIMNKNLELALKTRIPACQDTGMAIIFASVGKDADIEGDIYDSINEGIRQGYVTLRKSVLDPITRKNTGDNTPAVIYTELVDGTSLRLDIMAKGFGSENMSALIMLNPSDGIDGIINAVCNTVN